ncbi:MAG: hypothetical protein AAF723_05970, partial [Pseudomonadota bacterium]
MRFSVPLSVLLHGGAVMAMVYAGPMSPRESLYVPPVPIELITEAELAELLSVPETVKAPEPDPAPEPEPVVPEDPLPEPDPLPDVVPTEAPVPPPTPAPPPEEPEEVVPEPDPEPEPAPEPTPPPEPEPVARPKPPETLDLAALESALKDLNPDEAQTRAPTVISEGAAQADRNQARIGEGGELTIREVDLFRAKMYECWNPDLGVPGAT